MGPDPAGVVWKVSKRVGNEKRRRRALIGYGLCQFDGKWRYPIKQIDSRRVNASVCFIAARSICVIEAIHQHNASCVLSNLSFRTARTPNKRRALEHKLRRPCHRVLSKCDRVTLIPPTFDVILRQCLYDAYSSSSCCSRRVGRQLRSDRFICAGSLGVT